MGPCSLQPSLRDRRVHADQTFAIFLADSRVRKSKSKSESKFRLRRRDLDLGVARFVRFFSSIERITARNNGRPYGMQPHRSFGARGNRFTRYLEAMHVHANANVNGQRRCIFAEPQLTQLAQSARLEQTAFSICILYLHPWKPRSSLPSEGSLATKGNRTHAKPTKPPAKRACPGFLFDTYSGFTVDRRAIRVGTTTSAFKL